MHLKIKMKILHLYHDIMNLYGEYANVSALKRMLDNNGVPCEVDTLSVNDKLQVSDYDFIYVGSGTESNQKYILEHLKQYKEELKSYVEAGKFLLMTGNSFEILGKEITDAKGKKQEGLGFFDFTVTEQERTRDTADAIFTLLEGQGNTADDNVSNRGNGIKKLVGFINKCSTIQGITNPLFQVEMGLGNEKKGQTEGIRYKNFYGTHLTGPMLIKNPYFLICLASDLCGKEMDGEYLTYEKAGYEITLRELSKRVESKV